MSKQGGETRTEFRVVEDGTPPEGLVDFIRAWCDGHKQRDPEAWAWTDYEDWQRDDMIASALDAFPALREAVYKHFCDRLLSGEAIETMAEHFFKAVRRMSAGTSDREWEWAGLSPAEKTPYFGCAKQALLACR